MDEKKRIKELEEKVARLEAENAALKADPSAKFYAALVDGVDYITEKLKDESLDFENDSYAKSVLVLSEKSPKVFEGLTKGRESFELKEGEAKPSKRRVKIEGEPL